MLTGVNRVRTEDALSACPFVLRSGMPQDDPQIRASRVVANYDEDGRVVSFTLIDRQSNQPTIIMDPLEFSAYRNAAPGVQALMQSSPQYVLDFESAMS